MSKRSSRHRKRRRDNATGLVLILIISAFFIAAASYYWSVNNKNSHIDKKTFCSIESPVTAVLIDKTDPINAIQKTAIKNELEKIKNQIPINGKLEVYILDKPKFDLLTPVLSICNPGNGLNASSLSQNKKLMNKTWENKFNAPVEKILTSQTFTEKSAQTPIVKSIQSLAVTAFQNHTDGNKLIIISDMLEHTDKFSLYSMHKPFFKTSEKTFLANGFADLRNLNIEILLIKRRSLSHLQGRQLISFWNEFFASQGGSLERIYAINE